MDFFGEFNSKALQTAGTVVGVTASMALARVLFRHRPPANLTAEEVAALAHRTRNYDKAAGAFAVVTAVAMGVGYWAACRAVAAEWDRAMPAHLFLYRTTGGESADWMWAIPAGFTGLIGAYWGHILAIRLMFGRDGYLAYQIVCNHKAGLDGHRFLTALSILTVGGALAATGFCLDYYTRVEENRFVENDFLGIEERSHPYSEVKTLAVTSHHRGQDGAETERAVLHVYFTDGTEWTAEPAASYQPLTDFLVRKTGKPLARVRLAEEITRR